MRHLPTGVLSVRRVAALHGHLFAWVSSPGRSCFFRATRSRCLRPCRCWGSRSATAYAKRFTWLSHFWLGAALMLAPLAAWVAIRAELAWPPVVLGAAVLLWVAGFDIIYACQDVEFDRTMRLHSVPARFGVRQALWLAAGCHLGMVLFCCRCRWSTDSSDGFIGRPSPASPWCWSTSTGWCGPTTSAASTGRSFTSTPIVSIGLLAAGVLDLWL